MTFKFNSERLYHIPHNTARAEEMLLLLDLLDPKREFYTFEEVVKKLLIGEIKKDSFKDFHPKPYGLFTSNNPVDKGSMLEKLQTLKRSGNSGKAVEEIRNELRISAIKATNKIIRKRVKLFKKFTEDPESHYKSFSSCPYKPTKTWKQNWVEFVRDYIDFASILGLVPNYGKSGRFDFSGEEGFYPTPLLKDYQNKNIGLVDLIMSFKYSNSVQNITDLSMYNVKVRPFFCVLRILHEARKKGIEEVERSLLFGVVGCLNDEEEINKAVEFIEHFQTNHGPGFNREVALSEFSEAGGGAFQKECGRISTGMFPFLKYYKLLNKKKKGSMNMISLNKKGEELMLNNPNRAYFYNQSFEGIRLSEIELALLYEFLKLKKLKIDKITKLKFYKKFEHSIKIEELDNSLIKIGNLKSPPISIEKENIIINGIRDQIDINPYIDFDNLEVIKFVSRREPLNKELSHLTETTEKTLLKKKIDTIKKLDKNNLKDLLTPYLSKVYNLSKDLLVTLAAYHNGENGEKETLALLFIKGDLKEKEIKLAKEEIEKVSEDNNINGVWVINYGECVSKESKLLELKRSQVELFNDFGVTVFSSYFNEKCLKEYLYYLLSKMGTKKEAIEEWRIPQFWTWGELFPGEYSHFFNDASNLKTKLI